MMYLHKSYRTFSNKDWRQIYEISKSRLLTEMDFSGFNSNLEFLGYFIEKAIADEQKRNNALRMIYVTISHLLISADFIIKDVAFLDSSEKEKRLLHGFKYGNLGKDGFDKILSVAFQVSGNAKVGEIRDSIESVPVEILNQFFCRNEVFRYIFAWAKEFERIGYLRVLIEPVALDAPMQSVLSIFLDFFKVDRKLFFESFGKQAQTELPITPG